MRETDISETEICICDLEEITCSLNYKGFHFLMSRNEVMFDLIFTIKLLFTIKLF